MAEAAQVSVSNAKQKWLEPYPFVFLTKPLGGDVPYGGTPPKRVVMHFSQGLIGSL